MRAALAFALALCACSPAPGPSASKGEASPFRAGFSASFRRQCERNLQDHQLPQREIEFACPCMLDYVLTNAPTDAELVRNQKALGDQSVRLCAAEAERRFP